MLYCIILMLLLPFGAVSLTDAPEVQSSQIVLSVASWRRPCLGLLGPISSFALGGGGGARASVPGFKG